MIRRKYRKEARQKDKKTQRPKREFYIVMSGQFRTLAIIVVAVVVVVVVVVVVLVVVDLDINTLSFKGRLE